MKALKAIQCEAWDSGWALLTLCAVYSMGWHHSQDQIFDTVTSPTSEGRTLNPALDTAMRLCLEDVYTAWSEEPETSVGGP